MVADMRIKPKGIGPEKSPSYPSNTRLPLVLSLPNFLLPTMSSTNSVAGSSQSTVRQHDVHGHRQLSGQRATRGRSRVARGSSEVRFSLEFSVSVSCCLETSVTDGKGS